VVCVKPDWLLFALPKLILFGSPVVAALVVQHTVRATPMEIAQLSNRTT